MLPIKRSYAPACRDAPGPHERPADPSQGATPLVSCERRVHPLPADRNVAPHEMAIGQCQLLINSTHEHDAPVWSHRERRRSRHGDAGDGRQDVERAVDRTGRRQDPPAVLVFSPRDADSPNARSETAHQVVEDLLVAPRCDDAPGTHRESRLRQRHCRNDPSLRSRARSPPVEAALREALRMERAGHRGRTTALRPRPPPRRSGSRSPSGVSSAPQKRHRDRGPRVPTVPASVTHTAESRA